MNKDITKPIRYAQILEALLLARVDPESIQFSIEEDKSEVSMRQDEWEREYLTGGNMAYGEGGYRTNINTKRTKWHISLKVTARGAKMPGQKALGL